MNLSLKINNNNYYYLAKEYLDIAIGYNFQTLEGIDEFLFAYPKKDIIEAIRRSNIIANEKILENSELVITYFENKKVRELPVYTFDDIEYISFDVMDFIMRNIAKKNIINQINNYFISKSYLPKDLIEFAKTLKIESINVIINQYITLGYGSRRILKDYIFGEIIPKLDEKMLTRDNKVVKNEA